MKKKSKPVKKVAGPTKLEQEVARLKKRRQNAKSREEQYSTVPDAPLAPVGTIITLGKGDLRKIAAAQQSVPPSKMVDLVEYLVGLRNCTRDDSSIDNLTASGLPLCWKTTDFVERRYVEMFLPDNEFRRVFAYDVNTDTVVIFGNR